MSGQAFSIRIGDRLPAIAYDFGFSLATALAVNFSAKDSETQAVFINRQPAIIADGTYTIAREARVLTPADGIVFYAWAAGDTATVRKAVIGLFHITWPGGLQETLPSDGYERIVILENF